MEGGNNLEQAVALVAAANRVVQDPNSVGSALRTISLRLRGTSVKVLEELGEETDNVVESTSKLQKKIEALSGVNILTESGEYKDTYTILKEIGRVWEDMSDIDQAALLELMAGKNRANTLSAILSNMKDLEGAYESALNAEGSALKENEAYLSSIQGRIDLFNNSVQTMWMNLISSDAVKWVVDRGTDLMKLLDTVHGKILALVAALVVFKKFKSKQTFTEMFAGASDIIKQVYTSIVQMITATNTLTKADIARALASQGVEKSLVRRLIAEAGLKGVTGVLTKEQAKATAATLAHAYADGKLTTAQYLTAASSMGLKTALQALGNVIKAHPMIAIAAVVAAAAWALDEFTMTAHEAAEAAKDAFDKIRGVLDSTQTAIQELEGELDVLQDKIDELNGKHPSFVDAEELKRLKAQREELEYSLKTQQQILKLQQDASNKQAIASMRAYTKAASEGADETQKTAETIGTITGGLLAVAGVVASVLIPGDFGTIGAAAIAAGKALASAGGVAAVAGGAYAGSKAGEAIGSGVAANNGSYDSWYKTYTDALKTAREDEQKMLEKYQKDSSDVKKLDKWKDSKQRISEIETEMYNHLSQMQQYMNTLEYGVSDEIDAELDTWYNFMDKFSIEQGAAGAKATALDRIFGENASEDVQALKEQILDTVNTGKDFDFTAAINGSQELKNTLDYVGISAEDVKNYFTQIGEAAIAQKDVIPVQTYAELAEDAEAYKEMLLQTYEIVVNNTKVTEEYKESLVALVGSEAEVNKYFDKNNQLIVKDAKGLNNLVKAAKKNTAQNTRLAKSQARLQYYELFKKMRGYITAEGVVIKGQEAEILSLYQEMNALEKTIAKYSRLEAQLLDTANAYSEFDKAQESDGATDYIGSVETWITALGEAFNTAELGSETAQVAIAGLVPESVYKDLDTVDEKMAAIYSYFKTGKLAQYFDIQFDEDKNIESVEMKLGNLRKFIEDGLANGTFVGSDWQHFDLSKDITSLEDFQEAMGVTQEVAFAFIDSIEDHDIEWLNGDYTSMFEDILPDNLANDIYENTSAMADLAAQLANGEITAEEYTKQWNELSKASQENAQKARENASAWIETSNDVDKAKEKVQTLAGELDTLYEQGASETEIKLKTEELETAKNDLTDTVSKLSELEMLDPVVLQVALDQAQAEIDAFEKDNSTLLAKVKIVQDKESGEYSYETNEGATLNDDEKKQLSGYIEDVNAHYTFENALGEDVVPYEDQLQNIEGILQDIYDKISGRDDVDVKSTDVVAETDNTDVSGLKEFFAITLPDLWADINRFFTETIPEKWNEFWADIGVKFGELKEKAAILKEKVDNFFTVTIPEKWDGFWEGVGGKVEEIKKDAAILKEKLTTFFTETLPEKWDEFWNNVGEFFSKEVPYAIGYTAGSVKRFFTDTIPEKWDEFWDAVKTKFSEIKEKAGILKDKIVNFFTVTIPEKWNEFWDSVGEKIDELKTQAGILKDKVVNFFTVTIPEKWNAFWDSVGVKLEELKQQAEILKTKVVNFFTVTIPEKWNAFWDSVETFITETVPEALETVKTGVTTFFTETIPNAINGLWTDVTTWLSEKASEFWSNLTSGFNAGKKGETYDSPSGKQNVNGTAHIRGTAHASGNWGLPQNEHNSLVGELGPEMVVDPRSGRYYTVGDTGAEMVDLPKGAIIFNHKQTEGLLKNGYVTSRGKAYAEGNAHVTIWPDASSKTQWEGTGYSGPDDPTWDMSEALANTKALSDALDDAADSVGEFEETIDWIEYRMQEFEERLGKLNAELENKPTYGEKNSTLDKIIEENQKKYADALAGAAYYENYAEKFLEGMNDDLIAAAKNGAIAITEFTKEQDEATVNAIQNYRDYSAKAESLYQQAEETLTDIRNSVIQKIDNIQSYGDAKTSIEDAQTEKLQNRVDLDETMGLITSPEYYTAMMENSGKKIEYWTPLLKDMQAEFDKGVADGTIAVGSVEWYDQLSKVYEVQSNIDAATIELEEFQNAINDIYWDNFDQLINRLDYLKDETQSLIDLMDSEDMVITPETDDGWTADQVKWTKEGMASLGLYAQQMEIAEYQSKQYAEAIDDLTKDYKKGLYSENEYIEKLEELKSAQYDSIEAYYDAQDAIKELQEARVDEIKKGIEKQVDAYEKLIDKQKEALDSEKDLYDFQKSTMESQKNISEIERQLAALANDHSLSAAAKRKQLEAELAEAQYELQDTYYNRSVEDKQTALDKELEDFQAEKDAEIQKWDEYLTNVEALVAESLGIVQANATEIGQTLTDKASEYNLTVSDAILSPWKDGSIAVSDYQTTFDTAMSSTMNQLEALKNKWQEVIDKMAKVGEVNVTAINKENAKYAEATKTEPSKPEAPKPTNPKPATTQQGKSEKDYYGVALAIWQGGYGWGSGNTRIKNLTAKGFDANKVQQIVNKIGKDGYIHSGKWRGKYHGIRDLAPYHINKFAKGSIGVDKDQLAILDELGEELQLVPGQNGRLQYIQKGTGIVPADITANLMAWGELDPQDMLDRNRPSIGTSHIVHNEVNITMEIAEVVHIDEVTRDTIPDLTKAVRKEMDSYMLKVNNAIKSKVR